jgi:hypothetical protein
MQSYKDNTRRKVVSNIGLVSTFEHTSLVLILEFSYQLCHHIGFLLKLSYQLGLSIGWKTDFWVGDQPNTKTKNLSCCQTKIVENWGHIAITLFLKNQLKSDTLRTRSSKGEPWGLVHEKKVLISLRSGFEERRFGWKNYQYVLKNKVGGE